MQYVLNLMCQPIYGGLVFRFVLRRWFVVVDLLFNELPIVCWSSVFVFFVLCIICVHSSFETILKRKRKLVTLLVLSYRWKLIYNN